MQSHGERHPALSNRRKHANEGAFTTARHNLNSGMLAGSPGSRLAREKSRSSSVNVGKKSHKCQGTSLSMVGRQPFRINFKTLSWPASHAATAASHACNLRASPAALRSGLSNGRNRPSLVSFSRHCTWPLVAHSLWSLQHCMPTTDQSSCREHRRGETTSREISVHS